MVSEGAEEDRSVGALKDADKGSRWGGQTISALQWMALTPALSMLQLTALQLLWPPIPKEAPSKEA
jgi:hypothetical protein